MSKSGLPADSELMRWSRDVAAWVSKYLTGKLSILPVAALAGACGWEGDESGYYSTKIPFWYPMMQVVKEA